MKDIRAWQEKAQKIDACGKLGEMVKGTRTAQLFRLTELSNSGG